MRSSSENQKHISYRNVTEQNRTDTDTGNNHSDTCTDHDHSDACTDHDHSDACTDRDHSDTFIIYDNSNIFIDSNNNKSESTPIEEYFTDFNGIESDCDTPVNGNLGINFKENATQHAPMSLICPDKENNTVYFVNYGKDNYIYELKDSKCTLLVEKKANLLQLWNNELYFLCDESGGDTSNLPFYPQKIYKYNLSNDVISLVLDVDAVWLYVNEEGIFYTEGKDNNNDGLLNLLAGCRMGFQNNVPHRENYTYFVPYKDYLLINTYNNGYILRNTQTDQDIPLTTSSFIRSMTCISGDTLYTTEYLTLYSLNLKTGERTAYDFNPLSGNIICGYSELKDNLFVTFGGSELIRVNKVTGEMCSYMIENHEIISDLFSDGNHLYAVARVMSSEKGRYALVELVIDEYEIHAKELTP